MFKTLSPENGNIKKSDSKFIKMNRWNSLLFILAIALLVWALLERTAKQDFKRVIQDSEKKIENLERLNKGLDVKIKKLQGDIKTRNEAIRKLNSQGDKEAIIYYEKITAVDSLSADSIFNILLSRYK